MAKEKSSVTSQPGLSEELARAISTRGQRLPMNPKELERLKRARGKLIVATLDACNSGKDNRPPEYLDQLRFEGAAIRNGSWFPHMKMPHGAAADITQTLIANPGTPLNDQQASVEKTVDTLLEQQ